MQQMIAYFSVLRWQDVVFAACAAYLLTCIIRMLSRTLQAGKETTYVVQPLDMAKIYEKCSELFPIDNVTFQGKQFRKGMRIKVTTVKQNVIEGEFIGMNHINLLCIKTNTQIIAHQLEKIAEITAVQ